MRRLACLAATVLMLSLSIAAFAQSEIPDLKGVWIGKGVWVQHQKDPEPDPDLHGIAKSGSQETEFTFTIDQQDGFRFTGTKSSAKRTETIVGVIGFDNKSAYVVDNNGTAFWRIASPDKIESIYVHSTRHDSIASRCVLNRRR